jgi:hypothetical protein
MDLPMMWYAILIEDEHGNTIDILTFKTRQQWEMAWEDWKMLCKYPSIAYKLSSDMTWHQHDVFEPEEI